MACCFGSKKSEPATAAPESGQAPPQISTNPLNGKDVTIGVFGGLGNQGKSVVASLLKDYPDVSIRVFSRKSAEEDDAKAIIETGKGKVSVVQCDANQAGETLNNAVKGCYGIFLVTAFWHGSADGGRTADSPCDANNEKNQALNVVEACKLGGVQHVVYSSLEDTRLVTDWSMAKVFQDAEECTSIPDADGRIVPHFDGKGEVQKILNAQQDFAVDFLSVAFYFENFFGMKPNKDAEGEGYTMYWPLNKPHYMVSVGDTGKVVCPLFARGIPTFGESKTPGTEEKAWTITSSTSSDGAFTGDEIAKLFSEKCLDGAEVKCVVVTPKQFRDTGVSMGMPGIVCDDFGAMFTYFSESEIYAKLRAEGVEHCKDFGMTSFGDWLAMCKGALYPPVADVKEE